MVQEGIVDVPQVLLFCLGSNYRHWFRCIFISAFGFHTLTLFFHPVQNNYWNYEFGLEFFNRKCISSMSMRSGKQIALFYLEASTLTTAFSTGLY